MSSHPKHKSKPLKNGAIGGRDSQDRTRLARTFHFNQDFRVDLAVAAQANRDVVTTVFAFGANPFRKPPYRRVVEEDRFDRALDDVDDVVMPPDVRELMRENGAELFGGKSEDQGNRQQHHRAQPPHNNR